MKYELSVDINCSPETVIEKITDPENMKHWQRGFIGMSHLGGKAGTEGARSLLKYKMGKRDIQMTETITKMDLPREMHLTYQTNGVFNTQKNYFTPVEGGTRWTSESEFQFNSIFMKVMGFLMPTAFKKQSMKYMQDFKEFAENGKSVLNEAH